MLVSPSEPLKRFVQQSRWAEAIDRWLFILAQRPWTMRRHGPVIGKRKSGPSKSLACLPIVANRTALNEFENQVGSLTVRTGTSLPDRISRTVGSESAAVSGAG